MSQDEDGLKKKRRKIALWVGFGTILGGAIIGAIVGGVYATRSDSESLNKKQNSGSSADNPSSTKNNSPSDNKDDSSSKSDGQTSSKQTPLNDITFTALNPTANAYIGQKANKIFSVTTSDNLTGYNVTYQWYENDSEISGATDSSYLASSKSSDTSGEIISYSVEIHIIDGSNKNPLVITKKFTLTIYTLPTITFTQNNPTVTTIVNQEATKAFSVTAPSNLQGSVPTYTWYKGSNDSSNIISNSTTNSYTPIGGSSDGRVSYYLIINLTNETSQLTYQITEIFTLITVAPSINLGNFADAWAGYSSVISSINLSNSYFSPSDDPRDVSPIQATPGYATFPQYQYYVYFSNISYDANASSNYYSVGWKNAPVTLSFIAPDGTKIFDFNTEVKDLILSNYDCFTLSTGYSGNTSSVTYNWVNGENGAWYNLTQNGNYILEAIVNIEGIAMDYKTDITVTNAMTETIPNGVEYTTSSNISGWQYSFAGYYCQTITYTDGKIDYDKLQNVTLTLSGDGWPLKESYNKVVYYWYMVPTLPNDPTSFSPSYTAGLNLTPYQSLLDPYSLNTYLLLKTTSNVLNLQELMQSTTGIWHTIATELDGGIMIYSYVRIYNKFAVADVSPAEIQADSYLAEFMLIGNVNNYSSSASVLLNNITNSYLVDHLDINEFLKLIHK